MDTLLTVADLARRWKVSKSNIYNLVETRQLGCVRIGTGRGCIRFTEEQVREFLERAGVPGEPATPLRHIKA
jgi:excisionase family DNA binding protein